MTATHPNPLAAALAEWQAIITGKRRARSMFDVAHSHGLTRNKLRWAATRAGLPTGLPVGMRTTEAVAQLLAEWRRVLERGERANLSALARAAGVRRQTLHAAARAYGLPTKVSQDSVLGASAHG